MKRSNTFIIPNVLWVFLCCSFLLWTHSSSAESGNTANILVLHSYNKGYIWTDKIDEGIESVLRRSIKHPVFFTEYMDVKRISDKTYLKKYQELFTLKYIGKRMDIIITSDDAAYEFILKYGDGLFPGVPVVFCGVNKFTEADFEKLMRNIHPNITGVVEDVDIKKTFDAAIQLHPETKHVYVVNDTSDVGKALHAQVVKFIPALEGRVEVVFFEHMGINEISERVQSLPKNSLVIFLIFFRDGLGRVFSWDESFQIITEKASVPVYTCWDIYNGLGTVGGLLTTGYSQGETAAKLAFRILNGEKPSSIPVIGYSPKQYMFNYAQMKRFGIRLEQLPEGSIVFNKPYSFYEENMGKVLAVSATILVLLGMISALILNTKKRKKIEDSLRENAGFLEALINSIPSPFFFKDEKGLYVSCNEAFEKYIGMSKDQIIGKSVSDLWPRDLADIYLKADKEVFLSGGTQVYEVRMKYADGSLHNVIVHKAAIQKADGSLGGLVGVFTDITERVRALAALQESKEKYRFVVDNADEAIFILQDGVMKFPNPWMTSILGYSNGELSSMSLMDIIHPEDRGAVGRDYEKQLQVESNSGTYTFRAITKTDEILWMEANTIPIKWEGKPATLNFLRDITQQKRLEAQLLQSQKMEAIGTLAGGIAHDFNNLLTGILGYTSLIMMDMDETHPNYKKMRTIEQLAQSGADLNKQLLGFARVGKYEVMPSDLNELITKSSDMFGRTRKEITVERKLQQNLFSVEIDRGQIEQVLLNLFVNAWQAMPSGGNLYIETSNVTLDQESCKFLSINAGLYVKTSISDTGIGIDESIQKRIFEPFFTTKEIGKGTGLGLASAYGIIRNHGGTINVYSEKGRGATFSIYLPATVKKTVFDKKESAAIGKRAGTVLLVDDQDVVIEVGGEMLKALGCNVLSATSGNEALELYKENKERIDLVILDMIMPTIGGGAIYDKLREIDPLVKVLLSSGYSIKGEATNILERGCDGFIQKPFNMEELSQKISEVLSSL